MINTGEKESSKISSKLRDVNGIAVLLCCIAFLVGRICLFEKFYTLAICFVGVAYLDKESRKWIPMMCILGILNKQFISMVSVKYIFMIVVICLLRYYMQQKKVGQTLINQEIIVAISMVAIDLICFFIEETTIFEIIEKILEIMVAVPLVALLHYGIKALYSKRRGALSEREMLSVGLILALCVAGMMDFYVTVPIVQSIYFRDVLTFSIILVVTYLGGISSGVVITMIMSTLLVVIGYMPAHFVSIYTLGTLMGASFRMLGRMGVSIATGIGLMLGFELFNKQMIDFQILGAYLTAMLINMILPKNYFGLAEYFATADDEEDDKHVRRVQALLTEKLHHYATGFSKLSKSYHKIAETRCYVSEKNMELAIEETGEKLCKNCSMKMFCWEKYIDQTYQVGYQMLHVLEKKGQIPLRDIPESFKERCPNAESFACTLSFKMDLMKEHKIWLAKAAEMRQLVGQQFDAVAKSLEGLINDFDKIYHFDKECEKTLKESFMEDGVRIKDVMVLKIGGNIREIHVYTVFSDRSMLKEEVKKIVQNSLDIVVGIEKYEYSMEKGYCYFKLVTEKKYGVLAKALSCAKGKISGDSYSTMEVEGGSYLLALADGMGSGERAAKESRSAIELLENFVDTGFQNQLAVKMINSVLLLKSDEEIFSTMDVALIDEYTGVVEFLKMGAAACFLLRNGEVETIRAATLPLGILKELDYEKVDKQLIDGDVIIMVTDGMLETEENFTGREESFKHFIIEADTTNPEYLSKYLMQKSRELLVGKRSDDMTIITARIWKERNE